MRSELAKKGLNLSKRRIIRLMKVVNLVPKKRRFFKQTTKVDNRLPVADNKLEQQFKAARPNEKWVSDISYVFTQEGWLYVAAILDLFSRKLIGLAMDKYLRTELVSRALSRRYCTVVNPRNSFIILIEAVSIQALSFKRYSVCMESLVA